MGKATAAALLTVLVAAGCGASAPRKRDAVPFARNFVLTVFPHRVSCATINTYARSGIDLCGDVHILPPYYISNYYPSSVYGCDSLTRDQRRLMDTCVDFQVIARIRSGTDWSVGTLSVGTGKDHRGHLIIDGVSFEGGGCLAAPQECQNLWANRLTP